MSDDPDRWLAVHRNLDRVLELPDTQRETWLADFERESPLIAAELRELLSNRSRPDFAQFLAGHATPVPPDAPEAGALAGRRVGPYILETELGAGGMGSVWLARRVDGQYEGRAAIKFLHLAASGTEGRARFRREGGALAKLAHPNIARLLDAGVSNHGQPYLVLEYVEGEQIHRYCGHRQLDLAARVRLFLDVLTAVAHAHSHLIIHRDIKPANILVTGDGTAKLLDFGIARLHGDDPETAPTRLMTPEYAAPEQLRGEPVTTATDVYALGIVLYVLLTGQHPFAAGMRSPAEVVRRALETEASRPSTVTPPRLARSLRGDLDNIVAKALNKDPTARYPTADAFAQDLRHFLAHEPVTARPDSVAYRARKFVRRHRGSVAVGVATALVLIGAIVMTTLQMNEARLQRDAALHQSKLALYQSQRAEFQARFAYLIFSEVGGDGQPITIRHLLEKGIEVLEKNYAEDPRFIIGMLINISGRYMDLGDTQGEYAALVKAERIARQLRDPDQIAFVQCNTVETELAAGRAELASQRMQDGLANLAKVSAPSDERRTECGTAQARLLWSQGKLGAAIDAALKVAHLMEAGKQTGDVRYTSVASMLEVMLAEDGRLREALEWNERSIEVHARSGREGSMGMSATRHNRASLLYLMGDVAGAFKSERTVVQHLIDQQGIDSVPAPIAHRLGLFQVQVEETDAGLAWIDRAVAAAAARGNQREHIRALLNRARAEIFLRRFERAGTDLEAAERLAQANPAANRGDLRAARLVRAQLLYAKGDPMSALAEIQGLLADVGYPAQRRARSLQLMLTLAARAESALGRSDRALSTAREALTVAEATALDPGRSADVGAALMAMAVAQDALGDRESARVSAARAARVLAASLGDSHSETRAALAFGARRQ
jgi:serine/threonine-protein kinase